MKNKEELLYYIDLFRCEDKYKDIKDYLVNYNDFFNKYNCNLYHYIRVSTEGQDFGRQILELYNWAKEKNIKIFIDNIYCDKYTGKSLKRENYLKLKEKIKSNDYLVTSNLSRLGRDWDSIKKEWYNLEYNNIKRIIIDNKDLSIELPNENQEQSTLGRKMVQDIAFSACLYSACMKIQEVSESTKNGMKKAKIEGTKSGQPIGRPRKSESSKKNFIKVLEYMLNNNTGQLRAANVYNYPTKSFQNDLKKCYEKYNTKDYETILSKLKEDTTKW